MAIAWAVGPLVLVLASCAATAAQSNAAQYTVYPLQRASAADVEKRLTSMFAELGLATHVVADQRNNQVLVRGPDQAHRIARHFIDTAEQSASGAAASRPVSVRAGSDGTAGELAARFTGALPEKRSTAPAGKSQDPAATVDEQAVALIYSRPEEIAPQLQSLLGVRLVRRAGPQAGQPDYLFSDDQAGRVELRLEPAQNRVRLVGAGALVRQLAELIQALDALHRRAPADGQAVRVIPFHRADPAKIREAVEAYRRGAQGGPPKPDLSGSGADATLVDHFVQVCQAKMPPGAPGAEAIPATVEGQAGVPEEQQDEESLQEQLRKLGEDVEVEILPDLDAIILRGRGRDVEELSRLIAELERISEETKPVIDIYRLRHVNNESVVQIISLVAEDLIGGRQGRVHVTPLVKPNALLLVGWGEAVASMKELIARLDVPVPPETQFEVFRLRHAPALVAAATVEEFFTDRGGLGTQVQVTPDSRTNSLIVRAGPRDLAEVRRLIQRIDQPDSKAVQQTRIFKLTNTLAADLAATLQEAIAAASGEGDRKSAVLELLAADIQGQRILKSGILADVQITPDPHTNTLIVMAPAESIDLLAALIERLDVPTAVAQIKVFKVFNGDASSLVEMLRSLLPEQVAGPQLAGAGSESTLVPVRFSVDLRTNSIIATGSASELAIVEALLLRLDAEEVQERMNAVYRLKNSPAFTVAEAINEFLRSERQLQSAAPGVLSPFLQIESEVVVVPEPVSNALIISATQRYFEDIVRLVEELDAQPAQVMIQVVIAEVELNDFDEFGVELGLQDSILFDRSLLGNLLTTTRTMQTSTPSGIVTTTDQVIQAATMTPGFNFNNEPLGNSGSEKSLATAGRLGGQALSHFAVGRLNGDLNYGGLVLSASNESISILIRALQETRRMQVLGRPQVMTLDNQPAFIQVGQRIPRITGTRFDGRVQVNSIDLENTGLILGVTPRISPDGTVVMEIDAEKSELAPEQEGIPVSVIEDTVIRSPSINVSMAQTTVSAASGETIVLGGLITELDSKIKRRVPWLADVPVLGQLFRYDSNTKKRKELLIILTPHVVRNSVEAERIKQLEAARMNWCLADVVALHGPLGVYGEDLPQKGPVIYPDEMPRGLPGRAEGPDKLELLPPMERLPKVAPREAVPPEPPPVPPPPPVPLPPAPGQAPLPAPTEPVPPPLGQIDRLRNLEVSENRRPVVQGPRSSPTPAPEAPMLRGLPVGN